jgi:sugar (pentulose or hexulose) kinase
MKVEDIRISGGIVRNPLWLQILADTLEASLRIPRATELGALGAAMNAAIGVGYYGNHEQAAGQMLAINKEVEPNPENRAVYADGYDLFKAGYRKIA